jgi:hypothetical protein
MIVLVIFFSYRVIQNLKWFIKQDGRSFLHFMDYLEHGFTIVTVVVSYNYKINPTNNNLVGWIISAFITTCTATFVDVKADWGFLN